MVTSYLPRETINCIGFVIVLVLLFSACSTTPETQPGPLQSSSKSSPPTPKGFFGEDSRKLAPNTEGGAAFAYINPSAQWNKYSKIQLLPVEFWAASDSGVSSDDQKLLTTYLYNSLRGELQKSYTLVESIGPDVLTIEAALTDTSRADILQRSNSVSPTSVNIVRSEQKVNYFTHSFLDSAGVEIKITDSMTGELLEAAVYQRVGLALRPAAAFEWGDAENAIESWSNRVVNELLEFQGKSPTM